MNGYFSTLKKTCIELMMIVNGGSGGEPRNYVWRNHSRYFLSWGVKYAGIRKRSQLKCLPFILDFLHFLRVLFVSVNIESQLIKKTELLNNSPLNTIFLWSWLPKQSTEGEYKKSCSTERLMART